MKTKRIQQQLDMIFNILKLVFDPLYQSLLDSLQPYKNDCEALQTMAENLQARLAVYRKLLKSITAAKQAARLALAIDTYPIISKARSYCIKNGIIGADNLNFTLSELKHMPFGKLISVIKNAIDIIEPLTSELLVYNITPAMILQWKDKFKTLKNLNSSPNNAIKARKVMGESIKIEMDALLLFFNTELCPLVADFLISNSDYYFQFQAIKRIGTPSIHHTRLLAHCTDELGNPVFGLTVTVDQFTDPQTGKIYEAVSAVSDPDGNAEVIEFFAGNRTVTLSGDTIKTHTFPAIQFKKGKAIEHSFTVQLSYNIPSVADEKVNAEK
jgi:hypothetical protein